jgi:hypothetical protein
MKVLKKLAKPETFLRLGLGLMFLYSGHSIYSNPGAWEFYVTGLPQWVLAPITHFVTVQQFLLVQGVAEMAFGLILLLWFLPLWLTRSASIAVTLELVSILLLVGVNDTTFRDIGLVGAALALVATLYRKT